MASLPGNPAGIMISKTGISVYAAGTCRERRRGFSDILLFTLTVKLLVLKYHP
jgi:hypothetical protein